MDRKPTAFAVGYLLTHFQCCPATVHCFLGFLNKSSTLICCWVWVLEVGALVAALAVLVPAVFGCFLNESRMLFGC